MSDGNNLASQGSSGLVWQIPTAAAVLVAALLVALLVWRCRRTTTPPSSATALPKHLTAVPAAVSSEALDEKDATVLDPSAVVVDATTLDLSSEVSHRAPQPPA
jgi:hypothetical protein